MSNIYITEPPTNGKVLLNTSVGDIEIELWSKECPKACRNFVQLCLEGYYNKTIFHRLVRGFIVQGGDPTGTGDGGQSIYEKPFKTETHSRLRFNRRGLVAMACQGEDQNNSQFFFTLDEAKELEKKNTIFGKVVGNTIYNMIKLNEGETNSDERPLEPHSILSTEVITNPFEDIVPREIHLKVIRETDLGKKKKSKSRATKDFSLLSFGDEAEEDEEETEQVVQKFRAKGKSSHDLLNDPHLSSEPVKIESLEIDATPSVRDQSNLPRHREESSDNSDNEEESQGQTRINSLREEADRLKREILASKHRKTEEHSSGNVKGQEKRKKKHEDETNDMLHSYHEAQQEFAARKKANIVGASVEELAGVKKEEDVGFRAPRARKSRTAASISAEQREKQALALLEKFQSRLQSAEEREVDGPGGDEAVDGASDGGVESFWLSHRLECLDETEKPKKVLDANTYDPERYDITDPRHPINQRKRKPLHKSGSSDKKVSKR